MLKKICSLFNNNKKMIIGLIIGLIIGIVVMYLNWPEKIAKLENGEEEIVKVDGLSITADFLYNKMNDQYGIAALLEEIDKFLLKQEYDLEEESLEYAKETAEGYYKQYNSYYGYTKEDFLKSNSFDSEETFIDYLKFDYLRNKWYQDYLESLITDKQVNKYYKNEAFGNKQVVLYYQQDNTNMDNVLKLIKNGKSKDEIKELYTDVTIEEQKITVASSIDYSDELLNAIKKLKVNESTKVIQDDNLGFVIVTLESEEKKDSFENLKKDIINKMTSKMDKEDSSLYYKAFLELRKKYNITFNDTKMEKKYKEYMKQK